MVKVEYFIKCFKCGELRPADILEKNYITLYTCFCKECCSITRKTKADIIRV